MSKVKSPVAMSQRLLGRPGLPGSVRPCIEMDKVGFSVIPHPAALHSHGALVNLIGIGPAKTNINRLPFHVQTVSGHARAVLL